MNPKLLLALGLALLGTTSLRAAVGDGIFAEFTTSMGSFTCRLDYAIAPKAVANFIGLATGQQAWLDPATGTARTNAYYDGLTFHRVISGFMIQGGSPNAQGTDGPGFAFPDEFNASARFTGTGVLAMANSGPDSNGSQYFITVAPTPHLNDVHTIFGQVISGTNIVVAISKVATDAGNKPYTNVVVEHVSIRRVGVEAEAFDIQAQALPIVTNLLVAANANGTNINVSFANSAFSDNRLYTSTNLSNWSGEQLGIELDQAGPGILNKTNRYAREFFKLAQVRYASSTFAPKSVHGRELTLFINSGPTITNTFDSQGTGSYQYGTNQGGITSYTWSQEPYRGRLWPIQFTGVVPMTLRFDYTNNVGGNFSGTAYPSAAPSFAVSGFFRLR